MEIVTKLPVHGAHRVFFSLFSFFSDPWLSGLGGSEKEKKRTIFAPMSLSPCSLVGSWSSSQSSLVHSRRFAAGIGLSWMDPLPPLSRPTGDGLDGLRTGPSFSLARGWEISPGRDKAWGTGARSGYIASPIVTANLASDH